MCDSMRSSRPLPTQRRDHEYVHRCRCPDRICDRYLHHPSARPEGWVQQVWRIDHDVQDDGQCARHALKWTVLGPLISRLQKISSEYRLFFDAECVMMTMF